MDDAVHAASPDARDTAVRSADPRPTPGVRAAAIAVLVLLASSVLVAVAPEAPFGPLTAFARASTLVHLVVGAGLAAAVAAGVAACALALHHPVRRALRFGWLATVAGTLGGVLVFVVLAGGAGLSVYDEMFGLPELPLLGVLYDLIPASLIAGTALIGAWLLVTGWLGLRRAVLGPSAGWAAILAGGGYVSAAAVIVAAQPFLYAGMLAMLATLALAVWALRVAVER